MPGAGDARDFVAHPRPVLGRSGLRAGRPLPNAGCAVVRGVQRRDPVLTLEASSPLSAQRGSTVSAEASVRPSLTLSALRGSTS
jgi:hypothetical protein